MSGEVTGFHSERAAKRTVAYARMHAKLLRQKHTPIE